MQLYIALSALLILPTEATAVNAYIAKLGSTNRGLYNASGRAYPAVSAQGERVQIVVNGRTGSVGGTSCASPIFSSVIALINDELLAAGKPALGYLNPWIYANPQAFNDITTGTLPLLSVHERIEANFELCVR